MAFDVNALIRELYPTTYKQYIGGSDGDPGEDQWMGAGSDRAAGLETWNSMFDQMGNASTNGQPGYAFSDARRNEILRAMAGDQSLQGTANWQNAGKYLNPEEQTGLNSWNQWAQQQNAHNDLFTYMPLFGGAMLGAGAAGLLGGAGAAPAAAGTTAAAEGAGTSWLTGGLASNAGIGGAGTAGLGLTAPAAAGVGSLGGGLGLIAPTAAAAGTAAGGLGSFVTSLLSNSGIGAGDLVKGGLNYLINKGQSDDLRQAGLDASAASNPLNDPKRQQYQLQLQQLLQNPETFYSTNPAVKAQLDMARQQFEANSAKMGVGGTQFNDYLKNVQNIASGTYKDQAELLSGLGGFGFPGGNSASTAYQGAQDAAKYGSEAFRGFGGIADKLFSGMNKMGQSSNEFSLG